MVCLFEVVLDDMVVLMGILIVWVVGSGKLGRLRFCLFVWFWRLRVMVSFIMVLLFVFGGRFNMFGKLLVLRSKVFRWLVVFVMDGIVVDGWFCFWVGFFGVIFRIRVKLFFNE